MPKGWRKADRFENRFYTEAVRLSDWSPEIWERPRSKYIESSGVIGLVMVVVITEKTQGQEKQKRQNEIKVSY